MLRGPTAPGPHAGRPARHAGDAEAAAGAGGKTTVERRKMVLQPPKNQEKCWLKRPKTKKHGGLSGKNSGFTQKNGGLTSKNSGFTNKNGGFSQETGASVSKAALYGI